MFSCIRFPIWPYPPKIMILFYTGKLYGLTGMTSVRCKVVSACSENRHFTMSRRSFPNIAFETLPVTVRPDITALVDWA